MPVELSRRAALTTALTGVAAVGLARASGSDAATEAGTVALPRTTDPAVHAARRLTFGATAAVVSRIRQVGLAGWVDEQLTTDPDVAGEAAALGSTTLPLPDQVLSTVRPAAVSDLRAATFARAAWGDHQLYEVLVEVFSNHLSICTDADQVAELKNIDDRDVIRKNVLGTFSAMLSASVQSPAMLTYLSNRWSMRPTPNENYARELLELHTVGVAAGYTHHDVVSAARVLSGLSVDSHGAFVYQPSWHVTGPVRVLGWHHPNADASKGLDVALSLVHYLAAHPHTARRLAEKLVRRFVDDAPPPALVASAAQVYRASGTAIVPVVRHIVLSKDFARAADRKTQRPFEWAAQAVRALGLQQDPSMHLDGDPVVGMLDRLGQVPFGWRPPDGYPDVAPAWATSASLLSRWNVAQALVAGQVAGIQKLDVDTLVGTPVPTTTGALVDRLCQRMLLRSPRRALRTALIGSTGHSAAGAISQSTVRALAPGLAALLLSSPEAQVR